MWLHVYLQTSCGNKKVLEHSTTYFSRLNILFATAGLILPYFCCCWFCWVFLSVLSICFSLNKHEILSTSFSSSTLKSDVKRKQKYPILRPVSCFLDGRKLGEQIICSDLRRNLHCMSVGQSSTESLWFSRIYLFFKKYSPNYFGQQSSYLEYLWWTSV